MMYAPKLNEVNSLSKRRLVVTTPVLLSIMKASPVTSFDDKEYLIELLIPLSPSIATTEILKKIKYEVALIKRVEENLSL